MTDFSSRGPTADGRDKPELYAPGYGVVSARSAVISPAIWTAEELRALSSPDGLYWTSQGTSMAAPQVTGTAALLLQKFPDLTPEQMKTRLNTRSAVGIDQRTGLPIRLLRAGAAVSPIVDLALGEALIQEEGIRVRWYVGKELGQASYLVYKAFEEDGPYQALSEFAIRGDNPYEILDVDAEPGRLHVYRVAVRDEAGLEEDLDTLRVAVPGIPQFTLRAPDPNPARDRVHLRFYLPASPAGGRVTVEAFDAMGRRVRDLGARLFSPGEEEHLVLWDLRGDDGRRVPAGMYFLRVTLEHGSRSVNGAARSLPAGPSSGVRRVVVLP